MAAQKILFAVIYLAVCVLVPRTGIKELQLQPAHENHGNPLTSETPQSHARSCLKAGRTDRSNMSKRNYLANITVSFRLDGDHVGPKQGRRNAF